MEDTPENREIRKQLLSIQKNYMKRVRENGQDIMGSSNGLLLGKKVGSGQYGDGIFSGLLSKIGLAKKPTKRAKSKSRKGSKHVKFGRASTGGRKASRKVSRKVGRASTGGRKRTRKPSRKVGRASTGGRKRTRRVGKGFMDEIKKALPGLASMVDAAPLLALGKPKRKRAVKRGGKSSEWIEHVKRFAKRNGMNYAEALSDPECSREYRRHN